MYKDLLAATLKAVKIRPRKQLYREVFLGSVEGVFLLGDIFKICGMDKPITNTDNVSLEAGKREVGRMIANLLALETDQVKETIDQNEQQLSRLIKAQYGTRK